TGAPRRGEDLRRHEPLVLVELGLLPTIQQRGVLVDAEAHSAAVVAGDAEAGVEVAPQAVLAHVLLLGLEAAVLGTEHGAVLESEAAASALRAGLLRIDAAGD